MSVGERTSLLSHPATQPPNPSTVPDPPPQTNPTSNLYVDRLTDLKLSWTSPADPQNPKNWPTGRKWGLAILVSLYALPGPTSSAMVVPALRQMSRDLLLPSEGFTQLLVSTFVLGWSLGPVLLAPLSEIYGRAALLNYGHAAFLVANTLCALERNGTRFLVLRFTAGLVGSAPLAVS